MVSFFAGRQAEQADERDEEVGGEVEEQEQEQEEGNVASEGTTG